MVARGDPPEGRALAEIPVDVLLVEGAARDHPPVVADEGDGTVRTDVELAEQPFEEGEPERALDDAGERPVGRRPPPRERDSRVARGDAAPERPADEEPDVVAIPVDAEVVAVAEDGVVRLG